MSQKSELYITLNAASAATHQQLTSLTRTHIADPLHDELQY